LKLCTGAVESWADNHSGTEPYFLEYPSHLAAGATCFSRETLAVAIVPPGR
jgi:hypothetical protein